MPSPRKGTGTCSGCCRMDCHFSVNKEPEQKHACLRLGFPWPQAHACCHVHRLPQSHATACAFVPRVPVPACRTCRPAARPARTARTLSRCTLLAPQRACRRYRAVSGAKWSCLTTSELQTDCAQAVRLLEQHAAECEGKGRKSMVCQTILPRQRA